MQIPALDVTVSKTLLMSDESVITVVNFGKLKGLNFEFILSFWSAIARQWDIYLSRVVI